MVPLELFRRGGSLQVEDRVLNVHVHLRGLSLLEASLWRIVEVFLLHVTEQLVHGSASVL